MLNPYESPKSLAGPSAETTRQETRSTNHFGMAALAFAALGWLTLGPLRILTHFDPSFDAAFLNALALSCGIAGVAIRPRRAAVVGLILAVLYFVGMTLDATLL